MPYLHVRCIIIIQSSYIVLEDISNSKHHLSFLCNFVYLREVNYPTTLKLYSGGHTGVDVVLLRCNCPTPCQVCDLTNREWRIKGLVIDYGKGGYKMGNFAPPHLLKGGNSLCPPSVWLKLKCLELKLPQNMTGTSKAFSNPYFCRAKTFSSPPPPLLFWSPPPSQ